MKPMLSGMEFSPGLVYKLVNKSAGMMKVRVKSISEFKNTPDTQEKESNISTAGIYYDNAVYHAANKNPCLR
jgi:hypothetical protein